MRPVVLALALAAPAFAQTELYSTDGTGLGTFGHSLRFLSDVTGDGHPDLAVGAPWMDGDTGAAYVLSGFDGSLVHTFHGDGFPNRFGESVSGVGDVDGDGVEDVAVGATNIAGLLIKTGYARIHSGADGHVVRTLPGVGLGDLMGKAVTGVGDVDADGFPDMAAGATQIFSGGKGLVRLYSGPTGVELKRFEGLGTFDQLGYALDDAGDLDADGFADLVAGAPELYDLSIGYGVAFSGADALAFGSFLIQLSDPALPASGVVLLGVAGSAPGGAFGSSVARVGDADGDGTDDFAFGAPFEGTGGFRAGSAKLVSGASGALLAVQHGGAAYDQLGCSVAGLGDVDEDGTPDWGAGGKQSVGWTFSPEVPTGDGFFRAVSGADGSVLYDLASPDAGALFGFAADGGVDVNGDGHSDWAVSAPYTGDVVGTVVVYTGVTAVTPYGGGCAGSGGFVPELALACSPVPGGPLALEVQQGMGGAPAVIVAGASADSAGLPGGCTLLVAPAVPQATLALSGAGPGDGWAALDAALPPTWAPGLTLALQAFVLDPGAPAGFAASGACLLATP